MKRQSSDPEQQAQKRSERPPLLTFVTGNKGKLREVTRILQEDTNFDFEVVSSDIDLPELQGTPTDISIAKCLVAQQQISGPVFIEDVCLCYNALGGMPGPYIKWFMKGCGLQGLYQILSAFEDKSAYALCVLSFSPGPGQPIEIFTGRVDGKIVPPSGTQGFGWDPVFQPDESNGRTFAEMSDAEKDTISHRRRAVEQLRARLKGLSQSS